MFKNDIPKFSEIVEKYNMINENYLDSIKSRFNIGTNRENSSRFDVKEFFMTKIAKQLFQYDEYKRSKDYKAWAGNRINSDRLVDEVIGNINASREFQEFIKTRLKTDTNRFVNSIFRMVGDARQPIEGSTYWDKAIRIEFPLADDQTYELISF